MNVKTIALAVTLFAASEGLCQTPVKEPATLQALLAEVHQLRQDIEAMTVASQRVQIALYALQMQDAAVARSAQRVDNARTKCQGEEGNRQHTASEIQRLESSLTTGTLPESEAKAIQSRLTGMKGDLDAQTAAVQGCQAAEADATSQLQRDRATLDEVQDRINRLDKSLEMLSNGGK
jgi:chromosome segregation ATPase